MSDIEQIMAAMPDDNPAPEQPVEESAPEQPRNPDGTYAQRESNGDEPPIESEEPHAEGDQPEASADSGESDDDVSSNAEQPEPKRGGIERMQERIRTLTAQKHQAEATAIALQQQLQQYQPQQVDPDLEFEDTGEFTRQTVQQQMQEQAAQQAYMQAQQAAQIAFQTSQAMFNERLNTVRDAMPDFDQVFSGHVPVSEAAVEVLGDSEKGPEIAYHLGKNLDEAKRIAKLSPAKQGAALARLEAKLSAPVPTRTTQAPPPPRTISAAPGGRGAFDPAEASVDEIAKQLGYGGR